MPPTAPARVLALLAIMVAAGGLGLLLLDGPELSDAPVPIPPRPPAEPSTAPASPTPPESAAGDAPLWSPTDEADVENPPGYAPQWSTEARVLVRVTAAVEAAGRWRVGDRVTLPLPQLGMAYESVIDELDIGPGPSISALGQAVGEDGRRRRFVVTVGPAHAFAYIDTPRGPYELVGDTEYGWLLPSSSMMAGFDFSEPDYILPERLGETTPR